MNGEFQEMKMASIDRHQYSEDIRKGAAKFVNNLNLDSKIGNGTKLNSSSAAKHQLLQKLGPSKNSPIGAQNGNSGVSGRPMQPKGTNSEGQVYILTTSVGAANDSMHLNTAATRNGVSPASGNHFRNPSISAIANFALGGDIAGGGGGESVSGGGGLSASSLDSQLSQGYEAQLGAARGQGATTVTPLSRLPGQGLTLAGGGHPNAANNGCGGAKNGCGGGPVVATNTVSSILASKIFARQAAAAAENNSSGDKLFAKGYQQQQHQQMATSVATAKSAAGLLDKRRLSAERELQQQLQQQHQQHQQQQQESLRRFQPGSYPQANSQAETLTSGSSNNPQIYENIESIVPPPPPPYMGYHHSVTTDSLSRYSGTF